MHYLMLITLAIEPGESSQDARDRAFATLAEDDSFCGEGGRFGSPLCDWFVIGGRWSGYLRKTLIGDAYRKALEQRFPKLVCGYYSEADAKAQAKGLNALWRKHGGTGPSPYFRSSYEQCGYDDDALPLDQTLYDRLLADFKGESECRAESPRCAFADLDFEPVDESFIGRKWIAVVDYHN
jgi:hypothetical protein